MSEVLLPGQVENEPVWDVPGGHDSSLLYSLPVKQPSDARMLQKEHHSCLQHNRGNLIGPF